MPLDPLAEVSDGHSGRIEKPFSQFYLVEICFAANLKECRLGASS